MEEGGYGRYLKLLRMVIAAANGDRVGVQVSGSDGSTPGRLPLRSDVLALFGGEFLSKFK